MTRKATRVRAQRLARARRLANVFPLPLGNECDIGLFDSDLPTRWAFWEQFMAANTATLVAASLALDGYPARWPRGVYRDGKGRR